MLRTCYIHSFSSCCRFLLWIPAQLIPYVIRFIYRFVTLWSVLWLAAALQQVQKKSKSKLRCFDLYWVCCEIVVKSRLHDTTCYNRLNVSVHDTTGCQTCLTTGRLNKSLYRVYKYPTGCQTGCTTDCSIVQPVRQQAASCKQTSNRLSSPLYNRFDNRLSNRLYRLYKGFDKGLYIV